MNECPCRLVVDDDDDDDDDDGPIRLALVATFVAFLGLLDSMTVNRCMACFCWAANLSCVAGTLKGWVAFTYCTVRGGIQGMYCMSWVEYE